MFRVWFLEVHFDESVLLGADALSGTAVVVHAGLAILGREYCVALAILHLVPGLQVEELPPHKGIEERVGISRDKCSAPVSL